MEIFVKTLKWGLIGCGDISKKRVGPALHDLENCELIAVNRNNFDLAESFAKKFGAKKWHKDWHDLINDKEIQAVYISTPIYLHAEQTIFAANAGKHVLCEKSMAMNQKECDLMIEACEKNNVKLGISYYRHFYPVIKRIKQAFETNEIGKPVIAEINAFEWFDRKPGEPRYWLLKKDQAGGGPMMDFGCHRIEVFLNLFGKIINTQSELFNLYFEREVEDTAYVSMLFENNVHACIRVSHAAFESQDTLTIYGTKGTIRIPNLNNGIIYIKNEHGENMETYLPHNNFHQPLIDDFTKSIIEDREPAMDGIKAKEVTIILDQIYHNT
jgi:predicted dehydrogenase